uniref:Uncharacterized protein n=1 Tax=Panagrolaimus sp. PS1159 TaxID=55785 RepID=A0AC35FKG4_9BILA
MYRKFYRERNSMQGLPQLQATCSTFTPPSSIFLSSLPEHVQEWMKEIRDSIKPECAILHAKSTLAMSQSNCHCRKVTCIKIGPNQCRTINPTSVTSSVVTSPVLPRNRKYIARLTSSYISPISSPTLKRISQHISHTPSSPTPPPSVTMRNHAGRRNHHFHKQQKQRRHLASYSQYLTSRPRLPTYGRIADSLDNILRICSRLRQLLTTTFEEQSTEEYKEEMLMKSKALVHILQKSAYAFHLFDKSLNDNSGLIDCLESLEQVETAEDLPEITKGFLDIVRKLVEETIHLNCWIIISYLDNCDNNDFMLPVALNHLIHLLLFESEPCLEVIQSSTIQNLLALCELPTTPTDTIQLLLRCLSVLCGVRAACVQLLSLGGFSMILDYILNSSIKCSIEAAGVLSQLTRPNYGLIELGKHSAAVVECLLIHIESHCKIAETMLLCISALANIAEGMTSGESSDSTINYLFEQQNALTRILNAIKLPGTRNSLVDEQVLSLLIHFPESAPSQDSLNFLLSILSQTEDSKNQRNRQKASLCMRLIGTSDEEEETFRPIKIRSSAEGSLTGSHSPYSMPESSTSATS